MSTKATKRGLKTGRHRRGNDRFFYRHKRVFRIIAVVLAFMLACIAIYAAILNSKLSNIARIKPNTIEEENRPDPHEGDAITLLLLGTDAGDDASNDNTTGGQSIKADVLADVWPSGKYRSDTMMIVHITADRDQIYVVSIPRDTFTGLHDETGEYRTNGKINSAFGLYGPSGAISTVEHLTDLRMQHLAILDWVGFRDLSTALGGVRIYIPETFRDTSQNITWHEGWHELRGSEALAYVRTRYGLTDGDFGRIERQQNFIRATMRQLLARGTLTNPIRLNNVLDAVVDSVILDAEWNSGDLRGLAISLRGISSEDVTFMTMPNVCCRDIAGHGNVVDIDEERARELFEAIRADDIAAYLEKYPQEALGDPETIN